MKILGKDRDFAPLLEQQADLAHQAATTLYTVASDFGAAQAMFEKVTGIEHRADELTREISHKVNSTFLTPLDKEDLHDLFNTLENVTDAIESVAARLSLYVIPNNHPQFEPLLRLLVDISGAMVKAVQGLRTSGAVHEQYELITKIRQLQEDGDRTYRIALADLLSGAHSDILLVIKWKDVYERLDRAISRCHEVAIVIENIMVKYG